MTVVRMNVTHQRRLTDLEAQAVQFALEDNLSGTEDLILTFGERNGDPFVHLQRPGGKGVTVTFREQDEYEEDDDDEQPTKPTTKPAATKKPAARKR